MRILAGELGATILAPQSEAVGAGDRLRALCLPEPRHWAFAAALRTRVAASDHLLCTSEIPGFQVAASLGAAGPGSPAISVVVHNIIRPRAIAALQAWSLRRRVRNFIAVSAPQIDFLDRHAGGRRAARTHLLWDHTDTTFFSPGAQSKKTRPLIVSVGLEQRDYATLAAATSDLDVDVKISGFSKDARPDARTFPPQLPANMTRSHYSWPDLVQLYRDADVVVVSTFPCTYAAGVQGLMEAMACGRPVVATATPGLARYVDDAAAVRIQPQDPGALRAAIQALLDDPRGAAKMGENGRRIACERFSMENYVAALKEIVTAGQ
jgi:glycosyltransferase involved in cell wall biosynthesis